MRLAAGTVEIILGAMAMKRLWMLALALFGAVLICSCAAPVAADEPSDPVSVTTGEEAVPDPDPERFRSEIDVIARFALDPEETRPVVVCVGSSSFRLWNAQGAIPEYKVFNCGFGGSHFSDAIALWDELSPDVDADYVLLYEGDNDTADRKKAERVFADCQTLLGLARATYPKAKIVVVPTKPSPSRMWIWPEVQRLNAMIEAFVADLPNVEMVAELPAALCDEEGQPIRSYYRADAVHLTPEGYAVWNAAIRSHLGL